MKNCGVILPQKFISIDRNVQCSYLLRSYTAKILFYWTKKNQVRVRVLEQHEEGGKGVKEWFLQLLGHPYRGASHQQGKPLHWDLFSFRGKPLRPPQLRRQAIQTSGALEANNWDSARRPLRANHWTCCVCLFFALSTGCSQHPQSLISTRDWGVKYCKSGK